MGVCNHERRRVQDMANDFSRPEPPPPEDVLLIALSLWKELDSQPPSQAPAAYWHVLGSCCYELGTDIGLSNSSRLRTKGNGHPWLLSH